MKYLVFIPILSLLLVLKASAQDIELSFSATKNGTYVQLDSIKIMDADLSNQTTYYWPDTVISMQTPNKDLIFVGYATISTVGIQDAAIEDIQFSLFQNYPNPMIDRSTIPVYLPEDGPLTLYVYDVVGKLRFQTTYNLSGGFHAFSFTPGQNSIYVISAVWNSHIKSIKLLSANSSKDYCNLEYSGSHAALPIDNRGLSLKTGEMSESGIVDKPTSDMDYVFSFVYDIPCPGTPTVTYEGKVYNTVQVYSQCWLKENLDVGVMIDNTIFQEDNAIIEKYCPENSEDSCMKYGGLYQWDEAMKYITQEGSQGICPPGWHIPTDAEVFVLTGAADSQYPIGDDVWNTLGAHHGYDCGFQLKSNAHWIDEGNGTDFFGFSMIPSGTADPLIGFWSSPGVNAGLWTSSLNPQTIKPLVRFFVYSYYGIDRQAYDSHLGISIRCVKN
jgi:uncharacterized protein (TIGR02145 family)